MDFEWILENTENHSVLIQEHWRLPSESESWKSAAFRKGWTEVWHSAVKKHRKLWMEGQENLVEWPYWSGMAEQY
eukprot:16347803-Heterocapsa_arctica.AAC.1